MLKRFCSGTELGSATLLSYSAITTQNRQWVKPKKRPKVGTGFHEKAQKWREEYLLDRHVKLANSLRAYVEFSTTKRVEPWDTRFAPFDRVEKDGVYIVAKQLMDDKLQLCNHHPRAVKRLFCNVGLLGPQVSTKARWKPHRVTQMSATTNKYEKVFTKDKQLFNNGYND